MKTNNAYHFHQGWRFRLSGIFPMEQALDACRDSRGRLPIQSAFDDSDWEEVTLPHTFNGGDLFATPIEDGGSAQRRSCAFYRRSTLGSGSFAALKGCGRRAICISTAAWPGIMKWVSAPSGST